MPNDSNKSKPTDKDQQAFATIMIAIAIGVIGIGFYSFCPNCGSTWYCILSIGLLVACASSAFGGFFGFLFGMPRALAPKSPAASQPDKKDDANASKSNVEANTNLEQISDWLTKILVGAGLTQLNKIPGKMALLSSHIAKGMCGSASDEAFVLAIIIFFGICGFLSVFLWTRLYMGKLLDSAQLQALGEKVEESRKSAEALKNAIQSTAERAMEDPLISDRPTPGIEAQVAVAAQLVNDTEEAKRGPSDYMILAFHEFQAENYRAAAENAEKALQAFPHKEMLWKINNLLGLCYHWLQGADSGWFEKAEKSYKAAIANKNSLSEEMLSMANLCFVYLDAGKYQECEELAQTTIQKGSSGDLQIASLCDLARIASAAAKIMRSDKEGAAAILNETRNISAFEYLFNHDDLPEQALKQFPLLPGLKSDVDMFLKKVAAP